MKQLLWLATALCWMVGCFAQNTSLQITTDKTTSLVFAYPIRHVDRGTKEILIQAVKEADNILLVKAASKDFKPTNLSVITADGSVYAFNLSYGEPSGWIYHIPAQVKTAVSTYANSILTNPATANGTRMARWQMMARLKGIYSREGVIYYHLELVNKSTLDYDIDFLRFSIRDKIIARKTAVQEIELTPLYVAGNTSQVKGGTRHYFVVALEKFTLPDAKYLAIEIAEKNGGRNLKMKVHNRQIIRAMPLPDIR